jgi:L-2-hydroxyglutarate oxidase LhgO
LRTLRSKAATNGVPDLEWLDAAAASALEPAVRCTAALLSPSSGIIDSHAYMLALQGDIESHGGQVVLNTRVDRLTALAPAAPTRAPAVIVHTSTVEAGREGAGGSERLRVKARLVINSAGLEAVSIARGVESASTEGLPHAHFAKGHYFSLGRRSPFSRLVYPLPEPGGLGVHVTLDMAGQARFGPDVEWLDGIDPRSFDYTVDPRRSGKFMGEIRKYWPELRDDDLVPAYTGIRPKISGRGEPAADFMLLGFERHGTRGLIHLLGIESPGLTSSLSIAQSVAELAMADLAIR